jgi:hypothetical protein
MIDPYNWAKRWKSNAETGKNNSLMDSGWSARIAENCQLQSLLMLRELLEELRKVAIRPEDFFDRPELAAVLTAVHASMTD